MHARRKRDRKIETRVVPREANKREILEVSRWKLAEAGDCQRTRYLSRSVGAEVEEDHRVAILNRGDRRAVRSNDRDGLDEFVSNSPFVRFADPHQRIGRAQTDGLS